MVSIFLSIVSICLAIFDLGYTIGKDNKNNRPSQIAVIFIIK